MVQRFSPDKQSSCPSCSDAHKDACAEHDHDESMTIVMSDCETGEEFTFEIVDHFDFEDEVYVVLLTKPDEGEDDDQEWVIAKVTDGNADDEDGSFELESLDDETGERVYAYYERLLDAEDDDEV